MAKLGIGTLALLVGGALVAIFMVGALSLILVPNRALDPLRPRFVGGEGVVGGLLNGVVSDF